MKDLGGRLLTALLWACVVVAVPLVGVRWVDSSIGIVAVLQSVVPMAVIVVLVLAVIAAATRRWRITAAAGTLLVICATIAVPSVLGHKVAPSRDDLVVMSANLEYGGADAQSLVFADFNSSWGHPGFRAVAESMTDVHRATGQGWVRTWPQGRRLTPAFIQLDHVLVGGMGVVSSGVAQFPDTDHAAVWARISPHHP